MRTGLRGFLAATALLLVAAMPAKSYGDETVERARAHIGFGADHPIVQRGWRAFLDRLAEEAPSAKLDIFLDGPAPDDARAIENLGRGDYAYGAAALPAFPSRFPYSALLAELGLAGGDDELAATAAATELMMFECPPCLEAFRQRRVVFLGAYSAARYVLISQGDVASVGAFNGLAVTTPGSAWDRLIGRLGGNVVAGSADANALIDEGKIAAIIATPLKLSAPEVSGFARHVLAAPFGAYRGAAAFLASADHWSGLTPARRRAALRAASDGLVAGVWGYQNMADAALSAAAARGIVIAPAPPNLADAIRSAIADDSRRVAATAKERFGVDDADAFLDRFLLLYDKFAVILADVNDAAAAAAVLRQEIFDRVDINRYGLEAG